MVRKHRADCQHGCDEDGGQGSRRASERERERDRRRDEEEDWTRGVGADEKVAT